MTKEEYIALYEKFLRGQTSPEEEARLLSQPAQEQDWDEGSMGKKKDVKAEVFEQISRRINAPVKRIFPWKTVAAAVLIPLAGFLTFQLLNKPEARMKPATEVAVTKPVNDVSPGSNKAMLKLAGGEELILDDLAKNQSVRRGQLLMKKTADGKLSIHVESTTDISLANQINTLKTPRGGQYQIELPDGTSVQLNAGSSISFPTAFTGKSREVSLNGEAFFDVAQKADQPFYVNTAKTRVDVLGTSFNVMAYDDEAAVKTTLVTGAVRVNSGHQQKMLRPGQQARVQASGNLDLAAVNVDDEIAWITGEFRFNQTDLRSVMRQLSRWYDVDIVWKEGVPNEVFKGTIKRDRTLSQVLHLLELTGVHFEIKNRTIIISP